MNDKPGSTGVPALTLMLCDLRSPINIGMILRLAETYGVAIGIAGSSDVLNDDTRRSTIRDFACGALERAGYDAMSHIPLSAASGRRLIATSIEPDAVSLPDFSFRRGDIVLLGNEYDGLAADVAARCDARIRIPMANVWTPKPVSRNPIDPNRIAPVPRDGMPNLNVAVAAGIICYQWLVSINASGAP